MAARIPSEYACADYLKHYTANGGKDEYGVSAASRCISSLPSAISRSPS